MVIFFLTDSSIDESYNFIDKILNEVSKDFNKGFALGSAAATTGALASTYELSIGDPIGEHLRNIIDKASNKPKSWISKKIYALRQLYNKWLVKARIEQNSGKIGYVKEVLLAITEVIDFLLKKLQNLTK